jgi:hypothetical protein
VRPTGNAGSGLASAAGGAAPAVGGASGTGPGGSDAAAAGGESGAAGVAGIGGSVAGTGGSAAGPPGDAIAYDADTDGLGRAIYLAALGGPPCTSRLTDPAIQAKQPAFSPDGSTVAFAALVSGAYQIHLLTLSTQSVEVLTSLPNGATYPAFSPDGTQLVYVTGDPEAPGSPEGAAGDVMVVSLATHDVRDLDTQGLGLGLPLFSPVFAGANQILAGSRVALVALDLTDGSSREVVPITGRIPNPQDPTPSPDGIRYAFSDYCGPPGLNLYIARIDGTTGDTCANALPIAPSYNLISADWGQNGYIAAEIQGTHGLVVIDDKTFAVGQLGVAPKGRNPSWAPTGTPMPTCQ